MKRVLVLLCVSWLAALVMSGCSAYVVAIEKDSIAIANKHDRLVIKGETGDKNGINFGPAYVTQYHFSPADSNTLLMYEDIEVDMIYEINYALWKMIDIIFDAKKVHTVCSDGHLTFYQVALDEKRMVNMIAQESVGQYMTLIYGFDDASFAKHAARLCKKEVEPLLQTRNPWTTVDPGKLPLSEWSPAKQITEILFRRLRRI
jgi:hypothetical protein